LLSGSWKTPEGGRTAWVTPLFHASTNAEGKLTSLHAGPYFQGRDFWAIPPLFSASWDRSDGGRTTWITPLFHSTTDAAGRVESLHAGPYFQGRTYGILPPLYWDWTEDDGTRRTVIPLLFVRTQDSEGTTTSLLWPLATHYQGAALDTSLTIQLRPFVIQSAGEDYEVNFLWRLFSIRAQGDSTRVMVGPLWWSETPAGDEPKEFQILGGLFARDCNREKKLYRYRFLWVIPMLTGRYQADDDRTASLDDADRRSSEGSD
jgi:hypothetical protein